MHNHDNKEMDSKAKKRIADTINSCIRRGDLQSLCYYVSSLDQQQQALAYYNLTSKTNSSRALGLEYILLTAKALKAASNEDYHLCNLEFERFAGIIEKDQRKDTSIALLENLHDTFPFYTAIACNSWLRDDGARVSEAITNYYKTTNGNNEKINALFFFLANSFDWQTKGKVIDDLVQKYIGGKVKLDNSAMLLKLSYERNATDMDDARTQANLATQFFDIAESEEKLTQMIYQTFSAYTGPFSVSFLGHWSGGSRDNELERNKNELLLPHIGNIIESAQSEEVLSVASDFVYFTQRRSSDVAEKLYGRLQDSKVGYVTKLRMLRALTESGLPKGINSDRILSQVEFKQKHDWMPNELKAVYNKVH